MNTKCCRDCGSHQPVPGFTKNARSRDGSAFSCKRHLAERPARSREARRTKPRVTRRAPEGPVVPDGCKWCPDCERILPLSEFVRTVRNQSGCHAYCKPGHNTRGKVSRDKVGGSRTYHLSKRYGITAEEADLLLASQDGVCAICRSAPAAHVDHDHTTGAVRALLGFTCNGGLGQFRDDPRLLHAAAHYVSLHTARQKVLAGMDAAGSAREGSTRPGEPPVGSGRRPGNRPRGLGGRARRHVAAREADG